MRYIKDIPNTHFKIALYQWNNKYIIKIESGMYEQTYKIDAYEVNSSEELEMVVDKAFLDTVMVNFNRMHENFTESLLRNEITF